MSGSVSIDSHRRGKYPEKRKLQRLGEEERKLILDQVLLNLKSVVVCHSSERLSRWIIVFLMQLLHIAET